MDNFNPTICCSKVGITGDTNLSFGITGDTITVGGIQYALPRVWEKMIKI